MADAITGVATNLINSKWFISGLCGIGCLLNLASIWTTVSTASSLAVINDTANATETEIKMVKTMQTINMIASIAGFVGSGIIIIGTVLFYIKKIKPLSNSVTQSKKLMFTY